MTPTFIFIILFSLIVLGAAGAVVWGYVAAKRKGGSEKSLSGGRGAKGLSGGRRRNVKPAAVPMARPEKAKKPTDKQASAVEKRFHSAKKRFLRTIDRRIQREPIIGERLRRQRDMVLGWYEQNGKVEKLRYLAADSRSACKVCQGRHGKEYSLLDTDVVARILPPSHTDTGGKKECNCTVAPVMAAGHS
jgi:hypothetical protein